MNARLRRVVIGVPAAAVLICLLSQPAGSGCPRDRFVSFEIQNFTDQEVNGFELLVLESGCEDLTNLWFPSNPGYYDSIRYWYCSFNCAGVKWYFPPVAPGDWKRFRWEQPDLGYWNNPQIKYAAWTADSLVVAPIPFPSFIWWPSWETLYAGLEWLLDIPPEEGVLVKRWIGLPDVIIPLDSLQADNDMVVRTEWVYVDEHEQLLPPEGPSLIVALSPNYEPAALAMYTLRMLDGALPYMLCLNEAKLVYDAPSAIESSRWGRIKSMFR